MRTLTIHREKAFAGCIMPVRLYIADEIDGDIKIDGVMCRLLGSIGNGQTKTFMIGVKKEILYGAYGKSDLFFDKLRLPCSEKNITISGKCKLDPEKGNPFRFNQPSLSADKIEAIIKIAGLITQGDKEVINTVRDMVVKPIDYFTENSEEYLERGIEDWSNLDEMMWLGMVDVLIQNNYAAECDYNAEAEDFAFLFGSLKNIEKKGLAVNQNILNEGGSITDWCETIDSEWEKVGYCVGCIDINSDSYILFPISISLLDRLDNYASCFGHTIVYAQDN